MSCALQKPAMVQVGSQETQTAQRLTVGVSVFIIYNLIKSINKIPHQHALRISVFPEIACRQLHHVR